jgi:hypothetical protein
VTPVEHDRKPVPAGNEDKLEHAKWILDMHLHWISASEVKAGAIVAIDTAMLGALAAAFSALPSIEHTAWANLSSFIAASCLLIAIFCTAMSVLPRTDGPPNSFLFFGKIVKRSVADYLDAFRRADGSAFLDDCIDQVYRNAEIACTKFRWVRNAMVWSFAALSPWVISLACLMKA